MILESVETINRETIAEHLGLLGVSVFADGKLICNVTEVDTVNKCVTFYKKDGGEFIVDGECIVTDTIHYTTIELYDVETGKLLYTNNPIF